MRKINAFRALSMTLVLALSACQQQLTYDTEHSQQTIKTRQIPELHYNVPPQVIYRIDDHRFVTLENYNHCLGYAWYSDTRTDVRTKIGLMWPTGFRGRLIIDDPSGMNVAIPRVSRNVCGDRGCIDYVAYSSDGGRSFNWTRYDNYHTSFDPVADSDKYVISVTKDAMYITTFTYKYRPLSEREMPVTSETHDLLNDPSITDRYPLALGYIYGRNPKLPEGIRIQENVKLPSGLRTPSGADRFTCDASIHDPNASE
ncbi:hypothetical protein OKW43_006929 [Paraburkholderia sp. WC7.3g]|uniref:Tli3-like domain-containing protein n=1 Tax=Paraburkholderia podalyriae TaxID=1938811 RepID=A0ABR7PND0_9BURK|nr:hypothetical protein [Paraburkholderia podalyriae]MBC8747548.1 hypothetical protein [Paraburkholderia podalyriae]